MLSQSILQTLEIILVIIIFIFAKKYSPGSWMGWRMDVQAVLSIA